jgi:predicted secreted hydrolase
MKYSIFALIFVFLAACKLVPYSQNDTYKERAHLPEEEAPHFKNSLEWWYFTGHLYDADSNEYGIEYVFFHFNPRNKRDFLMVNIAVSDPQRQAFYYDYKIVPLKEHLQATLPLNLLVKSKKELWTLQGQEGAYGFQAMMNRHPVGVSITTQPDKPLLLHSGTGYEQYGPYAKAGYYSYPRLHAEGSLLLHGLSIPVRGEIWYDRQWNCIGVFQQEVAWDWFSVQFADKKEELMLYRVHHRGDNAYIYGGSLFTADGEEIHIEDGEIVLEELEEWYSPASKTSYPTKWRVQIPRHGYDLEISAKIPHQELGLKFGPLATLYYWEGMCSVEGTRDGVQVMGNSYIEITNRAKK